MEEQLAWAAAVVEECVVAGSRGKDYVGAGRCGVNCVVVEREEVVDASAVEHFVASAAYADLKEAVLNVAGVMGGS